MKEPIKLSNLLDNYDEFFNRIQSNLDTWTIQRFNKIKQTRISTTFDIRFILMNFDDLCSAFDYSINELEKIKNFIKSNRRNKEIIVNKIKKDWELLNDSDIIFNPQVSDPYLGESPIEVTKAKKAYLNKIKSQILYHSTSEETIPIIAKEGLINNLNYFAIGDKFSHINTKTYGLVCVNVIDVLDRIYPDPEFFPISIEFEGMNFSGWLTNWIDAGINLDVLFLLQQKFDNDLFGWYAVIGNIKPELIKKLEIKENNFFRRRL